MIDFRSDIDLEFAPTFEAIPNSTSSLVVIALAMIKSNGKVDSILSPKIGGMVDVSVQDILLG